MNTRGEFFREPTAERYWSESHSPDATDLDTGIAIRARIGFHPNREVANFGGSVSLEEENDVYRDRDEGISPADVHGSTVDNGEWRFEMRPEEPTETWTLTLTGTLRRMPGDDPEGTLADRGEPATAALDLTVRSRHDPFYDSEGTPASGDDAADRNEAPTHVTGVFEADGTELELSGAGERDHSWGRHKGAGDAEWLWSSGGFEDGTASTLTSEWLAGEATPHVRLELAWDGGRTTVDVAPLVTTPIERPDEERDQRAVLNRSAARQTRDGDGEGRGVPGERRPTDARLSDVTVDRPVTRDRPSNAIP